VRAPNNLYERDKMGRIERVADDATLRVPALGLNAACTLDGIRLLLRML